ncbi:blue-light-activated protein [mine drainage metagenome]|uniref:Blue-light-activated protein n=1 Tax=mine drainage metagenome TaxID=410659 RepID=A0A1J5SQ09_9ZZZZ
MTPPPLQPLRILYLEDDPVAVEMVRSLFAEEGVDCEIVHVDDRDGYLRVLAAHGFDLILSDFNLPSIDGFEALRLRDENAPATPFVVISGALGEQTAVDTLKKGATDFVLKDSLVRLPSVVRRAMCEAREHDQRLSAEEALKRSEERFRRLAENASDIIVRYACHPEPAIEYVNGAIHAVTGYLPEDFYGNPGLCLEVIHPDDRTLLEGRLRKPGVDPASLVVRWRGRDEHVAHIEQRLTPVFDEVGAVVAIEGIGRDITERILAEEQIRLLSEAIAQSPVGIVIVEPDDTLVFANRHLCELSGYTPLELRGRSTRLLFADNVAVEELNEMNARRAEGKPWSGELVLRAKDGTARQIRAMIAPLRGPDGSIRHFLGVLEDISLWKTEQQTRRELETQLFQAQKMEAIGALAGGIAHDFNNILTAIIGFAELLGQSSRQDEEDAVLIRHILTAGRRAKDLVAQILSFSRIQEQSQAVVDLSHVVGEALRLLRASLPATIEIHRSFEPALVLANPTQIHQVVLNLCTNAEHAMRGRPGRLGVSVRVVRTGTAGVPSDLPPGEYACLSVADTGHGMDEATRARIFERFFTTKKAGEGTGLGLSVVRSIVRNHLGVVCVDSTPGVGTRFDLYFPIARTAAEKTDTRPVASVRGAGQTIFVVDDEISILTFLGLRLERMGFRVRRFSDPLDVINAVVRLGQRADLIITDQTMPGMTGVSLLRQLRDAGCRTPAILSSGYRVPDEEGLSALADVTLIAKPFTGESLSNALAAVLRL